jgi:hypothetical protein
MNKIRELLNNPLVTGIAGLLVGALFGLVILGWWLWPVKWTDATPAELSSEWQEQYLRLTIQAFGSSGDASLAQKNFEALGAAGPELLQKISQSPQNLSSDLIASFSSLVAAGAAPSPTQEPKPTSGSSRLIPYLIGGICLVVVIIIALAAALLLRGRYVRSGSAEATPAQMAMEARRQTGMTDYVAEGSEPPVAQFMASYKIGDDLFDDSFSIDSPSGEFLGECGVGISETIGVGEQKKVTAFEVWLFDKNDIQTVTKVLMSMHAFQDVAIRQRLEAKGEPVQAEPGAEFVLETQTLQMVARVVDMGYGEGAMPPQSYFDHLLLELAVWQKPA